MPYESYTRDVMVGFHFSNKICTSGCENITIHFMPYQRYNDMINETAFYLKMGISIINKMLRLFFTISLDFIN